MPQPEGRQLNGGNYSPFLTGLAQSYLPDPKSQDFIAKQIFPNLPVATPSGQFNVWKQDDFLRLQMKMLANDEAAPIIGFTTSTGNFNVGNFGVAAYYTARDVANYRRTGGSEALLRAGKLRLVTMNGVLQLEKLTADLCQTAANWSVNYTGVASGATISTGGQNFLQWDQAGSDPVADVDELKRRFRLATTFRLNRMVIPEQVLFSLKKNASLIDRIKYGGTADRPTQVTLDQLKALFGVDNILVPGSVYNAAAEGQAANMQYFWGKNVWFGYTTDAPAIDQPSAGYHFSWTGDATAGLPAGVDGDGVGPAQFGAQMSDDGLFIRYYDENRPARRFVESELWTSPNVTAANMGGVLQGVIA